MTSLDYYVIAATFLIVALGGAVAYFKRDYVTRGMGICFFTSLWGLLALILSPASKARSGDEHDEHNWPPCSWLAVAGILLTLFIVLLMRWNAYGSQ
jgi:hypothetical protein